MSLYVVDETGRRYFKLEGQGCRPLTEDSWVQWLEHQTKQKDAMIDWMSKELAHFSKTFLPDGLRHTPEYWRIWAEKAVQDERN